MPMWYAEAGGREYKKKILNQIPKLDEIPKGMKKAFYSPLNGSWSHKVSGLMVFHGA
jgi:hypothetical protein